MTGESIVTVKQGGLDKDQAAKLPSSGDPRQKAVAIGLEFIKRCFEAKNEDELHLMLTNDIRGLVPFDRCVLIVHLGGDSRMVAVGNQPSIEKRAKFYEAVSESAEPLKGLGRAVLLSAAAGSAGLSQQDIPEEAKRSLEEFVKRSGCDCVFCLPLQHRGMIAGHLLLEFFDSKVPDEVALLTLLNMAPFFAAALVEARIMAERPELSALLDPQSGRNAVRLRRRKISIAAAIGLSIFFVLFFLVPIPVDVGGESEVVPKDRHVAFCKIDGLINKVLVAEGAHVDKGVVLATLDPKELELKEKTAQTQVEVLAGETALLRSAANEDPSKLAESRLVEMKRKGAWEELQYIKWQQRFLDITAPVSGIILTKDIESLSGKKVRAGEPFCEIAPAGDLCVDVLVPEDRVYLVDVGQDVTVYLSGKPRHGYPLKVAEIAPMSEASPRLGNVYRVRAPFPDAPVNTLTGMKGIGKIHTSYSSLWTIVGDRIVNRWQRLSLWL
ncbi:MAG: HlyD family efflux transporter periplasmic adaptor subunit [Pseudomonadota bacterium]